MQSPQCKICPYCKSVQSLDSRYCSQCSNPLDESTYSALFKYQYTIVITALGTTCAFLIIVLFVFFGTKPKPQAFLPESSNKQVNSIVANAAITPVAKQTNAQLTKATPKKSPSPSPAIEIVEDEPVVTSSGKTESKRKLSEPDEDSDIDSFPSRDYQTGSRGGCYYISDSGSKTYVDRSFCGGSTESRSIPKGYIRGPRGGCYYINSSGSKTYVDRSLCN